MTLAGHVKRIKGVVFDLDGTLLNTLPGLAMAYNKSLGEMGFPEQPVDRYRHIIGDGARNAALRCLPEHARTQGNVAELMGRFTDTYGNAWRHGASPYDGIREAVADLGQDLPLAVLSNKDAVFCQRCVEHFFDDGVFAACVGYGGGVKHKPHPSGAMKVAARLDCDVAELAMIGDTATDMRTAVACNMVPVGVLWGFRDERELTESGAQFIVESPRQLPELVRSLAQNLAR